MVAVMRGEAGRPIKYDIDLNLLPRSRRRAGPRAKALTLLILVFAVLSMIRLSGLYSEISSAVTENELRLRELRQDLAFARREAGDLNQLSLQLEAKKNEEKALQDSLALLAKNKSDWSGVLQTLLEKAGATVALDSIYSANSVVRLQGRAPSLASALTFASDLENSDRFSRVVIVSYSAKPGTAPKAAGGSAASGNSRLYAPVSFEIVADVKKQ